MKTLILVRHAKSDWDNPLSSDFDRPLSHRGEASAPKMAKRLLKKHIIPQYIVSSPALRAKTTANVFAETFDLPEPAYNQAIYEASQSTLLNVVNKLPDEFDIIALFGHNPGFSQLLNYLSGDSFDMPTCAVAVVKFDTTSWKLVSGGTGTITYYDYPKNDEG